MNGVKNPKTGDTEHCQYDVQACQTSSLLVVLVSTVEEDALDKPHRIAGPPLLRMAIPDREADLDHTATHSTLVHDSIEQKLSILSERAQSLGWIKDEWRLTDAPGHRCKDDIGEQVAALRAYLLGPVDEVVGILELDGTRRPVELTVFLVEEAAGQESWDVESLALCPCAVLRIPLLNEGWAAVKDESVNHVAHLR